LPGIRILPMSLDEAIETIDSYEGSGADADNIKGWQQLIKPRSAEIAKVPTGFANARKRWAQRCDCDKAGRISSSAQVTIGTDVVFHRRSPSVL
jgi:hypothetical protein